MFPPLVAIDPFAVKDDADAVVVVDAAWPNVDGLFVSVSGGIMPMALTSAATVVEDIMLADALLPCYSALVLSVIPGYFWCV